MNDNPLFDGKGIEFEHLQEMLAATQRQKLVDQVAHLRSELSHDKNIPRNRQCPICGGRLTGEFQKCPNCSSSLSWVDTALGKMPCQPGKEAEQLEQCKQEKEAADARESAYKASLLMCTKCKTLNHKKSMAKDGVCIKCQNRTYLYGCLFVFFSLAAALFVFLSSRTIALQRKADQYRFMTDQIERQLREQKDRQSY